VVMIPSKRPGSRRTPALQSTGRYTGLEERVAPDTIWRVASEVGSAVATRTAANAATFANANTAQTETAADHVGVAIIVVMEPTTAAEGGTSATTAKAETAVALFALRIYVAGASTTATSEHRSCGERHHHSHHRQQHHDAPHKRCLLFSCNPSYSGLRPFAYKSQDIGGVLTGR
jgi:hypothetical protein